ncbi:maintenance of telomere capping protein 1 [Melampsora americana]|nr:maintenance of telomere capping protein 1 [Melampsora americana]
MSEQPSKSSSSRQDVLSILDDLDSFKPTTTNPKSQSTSESNSSISKDHLNLKNPTSSHHPTIIPSKTEDAQSVLDFLDEITQRSSTPTASLQTKKLNSNPHPLSRKPSTSSLSSPTPNPSHPPSSTENNVGETISEPTALPQTAGSGWGWGSVLKQATSNVFNQAINAAGQVQSVVVDPSKSSDLVKQFNENLQLQFNGQSETAKKWKEGVMGYVKSSGIDQLSKDLQATGLKSLNDIMNAVVPPISEHEIIEVQLSYDMIGYDGIETLVYKSLSKIMEQVEGGDLVLNKGEEEKPKERSGDEPERDLNSVHGMIEGYKLALANLEQMVKRKSLKDSESLKETDAKEEETNLKQDLPITKCSVYIRIQPILSTLPCLHQSQDQIQSSKEIDESLKGISVLEEEHLFFLILLKDLDNSLDHATLSQSMPADWLKIPFEENEWVEEVMVEIIRRATEVIGQQYVNGRLTGRSLKNSNQMNEEKDQV